MIVVVEVVNLTARGRHVMVKSSMWDCLHKASQSPEYINMAVGGIGT